MPPGTAPAAVEVHDSMFGGIVAVLRGVDCWSVTVAPPDNIESCTSTVAGTVPGGTSNATVPPLHA